MEKKEIERGDYQTCEEGSVLNSKQLLDIANRIIPIFLNSPDDEMYNEVLKILLKDTDSRHGIFAYIDENGSMVAPSMTRDIWDQCQIPGKTYTFPREIWGGIWGRALSQRRALYSNGTHHVPEGHIAIVRSICVPIIHQNELIGMFAVANRTSSYYENDVKHMKAIADLVAPVLHARLQRDRIEIERRKADEAVKLANKKLGLMSAITRHDGLNQLSLILGYAQIAREMSKDGKITSYLDKIVLSGQSMSAQLEFTRIYQSIGSTSPEWQDVRRVFDKAMSELDMNGIKVVNRLSDVQVYADMMLGRIFYNLIENSLRHGTRITTINVHDAQTENGLIISIEDDGVGIPDQEKEIIFEKGYGKNTGYGLYVTREILDLTGIFIREKGEYGKGARFEILVPTNGYRTPS
ncbi:MAG: HAMP domain-containing histidine kinase [Candidatus Thermoplasmatota archaeon]|nr:HAMP domain-containing histidine kinase [Candidatus Thermoplasmatota archaeon]